MSALRPFAPIVLLSVVGVLASCDRSSADVRRNPTDGWTGVVIAVAADPAATWSLACRFRPVKEGVNGTSPGNIFNGWNYDGTGAFAGRLPGPDGRCSITLTKAPGPATLTLGGKTAVSTTVGETARTFI